MIRMAVDWLEEVRKAGGEWAWIWKTRSLLDQWQSGTNLPSPADVLQAPKVLVSAYHMLTLKLLLINMVKEAIEVLRSKEENSGKDIRKEAEGIFRRMAHFYHPSYVKPIGYSVVKVIMVCII